jgi:hypothetical protein
MACHAPGRASCPAQWKPRRFYFTDALAEFRHQGIVGEALAAHTLALQACCDIDDLPDRPGGLALSRAGIRPGRRMILPGPGSSGLYRSHLGECFRAALT